MNESAPAPARPPVPGWERVAAGVLAVGLAGCAFGLGGALALQWFMLQFSLTEIANTWQGITEYGGPRLLTRLDSWYFANMAYHGAYVLYEVGRLGLIAAGSWLASGRRSRGLRTIFWLAVLGHGLLALGRVVVAGRVRYLHYGLSDQATADLLTWRGGWLDNFGPLESGNGWLLWTPIVLEIFLAALVLTLRGWHRRRGKAAPVE